MSNPPSSANPLLNPPFYVIPGIDPSSPISAQTERIDQLNTLLLQEIDANFAKFHQVVTSRILPEIKRFAIASEPTREASQFWRSFFEAASSVRLPGSADSTLPSQGDTSTQYDDHTLTLRRDANDSSIQHQHLPTGANDTGSFIFDPPATSSTPLPPGKGQGRPNESWEDSMGSPFEKLDRQLRSELRISDKGGQYAYEGTSSDMPTPSLPSGYSLPSMMSRDSSEFSQSQQDEGHSTGTVEPSQLSNASNAPLPTSATPKANRSALPSVSKSRSNPFGPNFNGIVDMRSTPLNPKSKSSKSKRDKTARPPKASILPNVDLDSSSDEDGLPFGMSPPVTMNFTLPPKAQAFNNIARTPGKSFGSRSGAAAAKENEGERQAKHILDDLLEEMSAAPSPRMPTPDGLGRYSIVPGELQPGEGGLLFPASSAQGASQPANVFRAIQEGDDGGMDDDETYHRPPLGGGGRRSMANTSFGSDVVELPVEQVFSADDSIDPDDSYDSDGDDEYSHPPTNTGSGMGSMGAGGAMSSVPYSLPTHDNITQGDMSYLSSEGDITTTSEAGAIFGRQPPPQARYSQAPGPVGTLAGGLNEAGSRQNMFELRKMDEIHTYHGGRLEDAAGEDVELSPTLGKR
ncbi:hypothetical protein I317_01208 [Kwoniella heveanensis CBS 569]|uniref:DASH complex subunit ASK1 n=1 Tax=Kwoniella heveanensis BCC8398 TaxID=1296120 RepID=A0A1B9GK08_9TREE|nr:hypothetical protein I316_06941 [Kwoniella heveanensis BCC8398]OCF44929.1 hypothetical protein I317_01208 [Kwoniella heveanensis CBS 569]